MRATVYDFKLDKEAHPIIVEEKSKNVEDVDRLSGPENFAKVLCALFDAENQAEEHMYICALNASGNSLGFFEVSHGTATEVIFPKREILCRLLILGATGVIVAHNHPGGTMHPSEADMQSTKKLQDVLELLELKLLDHIIMAHGGEGKYYSFYEANIL